MQQDILRYKVALIISCLSSSYLVYFIDMTYALFKKLILVASLSLNSTKIKCETNI